MGSSSSRQEVPAICGEYVPAKDTQPPKPAPYEPTTRKICNQANLKTPTLKLVPLPDQPDVLSIQFRFDASAPCRVSTFVLATEDKRKSYQLTSTEPVPEPVYYDKGLGLQFPPDNQPTVATSHVVNTSVHDPSQLASAEGARFPLAIRLESLLDGECREGKDLHELPAGAPLPAFVQAQTTLAECEKGEDGSWDVRVVKQKMWVQGVSYDLQTILGVKDEPVRISSVDGDDRDQCVKCLTAEMDTTLLPCRHFCVCEGCARELKALERKCPVCGEEIESSLQLKKRTKAPESDS